MYMDDSAGAGSHAGGSVDLRTDLHGGARAAVDASDARLLRQIADGDRHAFELLYRSYFHRLGRFLHRLTRNVQLIEEIVDDTMLVVWNKARTWDGSCKVSTWVFAIAWRKAKKSLHGADEAIDFDPDLREAEATSQPERQYVQRRRRQALDQALGALPLEQRTVVQLTYFHDLAYGDIAAIMECPVNTVKTRMFHARRRLAVLLGDALEEEA